MLPVDETIGFMADMRDIVARTAEAMPGHEDYIAQDCAAKRAVA
jgi:tryptophan halogenase